MLLRQLLLLDFSFSVILFLSEIGYVSMELFDNYNY